MVNNVTYILEVVRFTILFFKYRLYSFVLSPIGNGLDCHRTWEAIYLGCVPVVLCGSLSEEFTSNLPIFAVEDWSDFFNLSTDQKLAAYEQLRNRSSDLAFDTAWKKRLEVLTMV